MSNAQNDVHPLAALRRPLLLSATAVALAFPVIAIASPLDVPNAFSDGDAINAAEFNENFDAVADAVNDNDARIAALEAAVDGAGVPVGTIAFFATDMCPGGWAEHADLRGRVPLGLPAGGMLSETGGTTALDAEGSVTISEVPTHQHSSGTLAGTATTTNSDHSHSLTNGAHNNHDIDGTSGTHDHQIRVSDFGGSSTQSVSGVLDNNPTNTFTPIQGGGAHDHTFAASDGTLGGHSHTVSGGLHSHSVSVTSGNTGNNLLGVGSVDVTMPYLQLLACEKL